MYLVHGYRPLPPSHVGFAKNSAKSSGHIVPSSSSPSPSRPSATSTSESCSEDLGRDNDVVLVRAPLQALPVDGDPRLVPLHVVVATRQDATLGARPTPAAAAAIRAAERVLHLMLGTRQRKRKRNKHYEMPAKFGASSVEDVGRVGVVYHMVFWCFHRAT